ncbi:MAG TPA: hypothetical protein VEG60_26130 [Candidatus Binatia bacterium]|nr:hypothetical protein [Candidatus Binatia bacterium]
MIHRWLRVAENKKITALGEKIDPERIHRETPDHIERLHQLSERVFGQFIRFFDVQEILPSP